MPINPEKIVNASLIITAGFVSQFPPEDHPEVAFAGRSNVGKSSLINGLLQRRSLARTSNTPGKTRLVNFYDVEGVIRFVDLPGYGYAAVSKTDKAAWGKLIDGYLTNRSCLKGIIQLLDIRHDPSEEDYQMMAWIASTGLPVIWALTKADKLSKSQSMRRVVEFVKVLKLESSEPLVPVSSTAKTGLDEVWSRILGMVEA